MPFKIETINYHSASEMTERTVKTWAEVSKALQGLAVIPTSVHITWLTTDG